MEWEESNFVDLRLYKDKDDRLFAYDTPASRNAPNIFEYFANYESKLSTGKTPNQHNTDGDWESIDTSGIDNSFSYNGVCHKGNNTHKQINYKMGHAGVAVVFDSGYGDGVYDVFGRLNDEGRVVEVRINME